MLSIFIKIVSKSYFKVSCYNINDFFRGFSKSHIYFECVRKYYCHSGTWVLQSLHDLNKTLEFLGETPIGSKNWKLNRDNTYCNKPKGNMAKLTFSQCYPDKFTCSSGQCVALKDRCNDEYDCNDETDEYDCLNTRIQIMDGYMKEMVPVSKTREPCIVYINISINAFPEINTKRVKIIADFKINLRWYDVRLKFLNLDHSFVKNIMSEKDTEIIWKPKLEFTNSLGSENPIGPMVGMLLREDNPLKEDFSVATEGKCYVVMDYYIIKHS